MQSTEQRVKNIIVDKLSVDAEDVKPEASLQDDLGADSLDVIDLIMEFEKEFNLSIPDEEAEKLATVQEIVGYIDRRQGTAVS